jgi:hypothetical protein
MANVSNILIFRQMNYGCAYLRMQQVTSKMRQQEQQDRERQEIFLQDQHEIEMLVSLILQPHGGGKPGREICTANMHSQEEDDPFTRPHADAHVDLVGQVMGDRGLLVLREAAGHGRGLFQTRDIDDQEAPWANIGVVGLETVLKYKAAERKMLALEGSEAVCVSPLSRFVGHSARKAATNAFSLGPNAAWLSRRCQPNTGQELVKQQQEHSARKAATNAALLSRRCQPNQGQELVKQEQEQQEQHEEKSASSPRKELSKEASHLQGVSSSGVPCQRERVRVRASERERGEREGGREGERETCRAPSLTADLLSFPFVPCVCGVGMLTVLY